MERLSGQRVDWVDTAKGICIILVVMMHSTLGVGEAMGGEGFMHQLVAFARPFRMPDFFLVSGLFLGLVIDRPWRRYLDRKVVHFLYFYLLWLGIQFAFKAPGMYLDGGISEPVSAFLIALVQPFGTLWFIYILPLFFVFTRMVKHLPAWLILAWAAVLEALPVHTGILVFDEFCGRYVYFFAGYAFAQHIFAIAAWLRAHPFWALAILSLWAPVNAVLVFTPAASVFPHLMLLSPSAEGPSIADLPLFSLALGAAGALAIVAFAALVAGRRGTGWLEWLGEHSIVIYLAFFLPMAVARTVLVGTGVIPDVGTVALLVTAAGVAAPAIFYLLIQKTGYGRFLFERPQWARIERPRARGPQPAE